MKEKYYFRFCVLFFIIIASLWHVYNAKAEETHQYIAANTDNQVDIIICVKEYGAIGDGIADDTVSIKKALEEGSGKTVFFPSGTYSVSSIDIECHDIKLAGEKGTYIIKNSSEIEATLTFNNSTNVEISGVTFDAGRRIFGIEKDTACLYFRGDTEGVYIHDCVFQNASREATAFLGDARNIIISTNSFNSTSALVWTKNGSINDLTFENNIAHDGRLNGLEFSNLGTKESKNIRIRDNQFYNFNGNIVQCQNVNGMIIENNYIEHAKNLFWGYKNSESFVVDKVVIDNNSGTVDEIIHLFGTAESSNLYSFVELCNNRLLIKNGLKLVNVQNSLLYNERYDLVSDGKISLSDVENLEIVGCKVSSNASNSPVLVFNNIANVSITDSEFPKERALYLVGTQNNMKISMNGVSADFFYVNPWWLYYPTIFADVKNNVNICPSSLSVKNEGGLVKIPAATDNFYFEVNEHDEINKIAGYSYEGRTITLTSDNEFTIGKKGNIRDNTKLGTTSKKRVCLVYNNGYYSVISNEVEFVQQPNNVTVEKGEVAEFRVEVSGNVKQYQWYKSIDGGDTWTKTYYDGCKTNTLHVAVAGYMNGYLFKCLVEDQNGNQFESKNGELKLKPVQIIEQPENVKGEKGEVVHISLKAKGDNVRYQWYKSIDNGESWTKTYYDGANSDTLNVKLEQYMFGYLFRCIIKDSYGSEIVSEPSRVLHKSVYITKQPGDVSTIQKAEAVFRTETNVMAKQYQWYKSIDNGKSWTKTYFSGATTNEIHIMTELYMNNYQFMCIVTDYNGETCCTEYATLYVNKSIEIVSQPQIFIGNQGDTASFAIDASGSSYLSYCWERSKDGGLSWEIVPYGATRYSKRLEYPIYSFIMPYLIRCKVYDNCNNVVYSDIVHIEPKPSITSFNSDYFSDYGDLVLIEVDASGFMLTYQWELYDKKNNDWTLIENETDNVLKVEFLDTNEENRYRCIITDRDGNEIITDEVIIRLLEKKEIIVSCDSGYSYSDNDNKCSVVVSQSDFEDLFQVKSATSSNYAELFYSSDNLSIEKNDVLMLHFTAKAEERSSKIRLQINGKYFVGNYPVNCEWTDYYIPVTGIEKNITIQIQLTDGYQKVCMKNFVLANYGVCNASELKAGMYVQNSDFIEYSENDKISVNSVACITDGTYLYSLGGSMLRIFDLNDYSSPISYVTGLGHVRDLEFTSDKNGIVISCRENGIYIVDISNKLSPVVASHYPSLEMATGVDICVNYLFACSRNHGVEILDISDVYNPSFCSQIKNGDELYDCVFSDGFLYVSAWAGKKVYVYDVSDISSPCLVNTILVDGWAAGVDIDENCLFVATGGKSRDVALKSTDPGFGMGNGMEIYDISNPKKPVWLSTCKVDGKYQDAGFDHWKVKVSNGTAVLAGVYNGIYIFDVSDKTKPLRINHITISIKPDSRYYVAKGKENVVYPFNPKEEMWAPILAASIADGVLFFGDAYSGTYKYENECFEFKEKNKTFSFENSGYTLNQDKFGDGKIIKCLNNVDTVYSVAEYRGMLFSACGNQGIIVLNSELNEIYSLKTDGAALDIKICDGYLYVAESEYGVGVYRWNENEICFISRCKMNVGNECVSSIGVFDDNNHLLAQVSWTQYAIINIENKFRPVKEMIGNAGNMYYRNISCTNGVTSKSLAIDSNSEIVVFENGNGTVREVYRTKKTSVNEQNGCAFSGDTLFTIDNNGILSVNVSDLEDNTQNPTGHKVDGVSILRGKMNVSGNIAVISNPISGLVYILDITDLNTPTIIERIELEGNPDVALICDKRVYIPSRHGGLICVFIN